MVAHFSLLAVQPVLVNQATQAKARLSQTGLHIRATCFATRPSPYIRCYRRKSSESKILAKKNCRNSGAKRGEHLGAKVCAQIFACRLPTLYQAPKKPPTEEEVRIAKERTRRPGHIRCRKVRQLSSQPPEEHMEGLLGSLGG